MVVKLKTILKDRLYTMESHRRIVKTAADVWRCLNGIVCIYKPYGVFLKSCRKELLQKISLDLSAMPYHSMEKIVDVRRISPDSRPADLEFQRRVIKTIQDSNSNDVIEVVEGPNYNDNPLVIGSRYQPEDMKLLFSSDLGKDASGLLVCGMNGGTFTAKKIRFNRWLKSYFVSGKFGVATDTYFHTGKIGAKSTYKTIKRHMLDRLLSSLQSSHQQLAFDALGVSSTSQKAYELASQGVVRPAEDSETVLYALKCTKFDLPNFEIEIHAINETDQYLKTMIHDIGIRLHSFAVCTQIRCVRHGPFTVEDALLKKHWDAQSVVDNIAANSEKLKNINLNLRENLVTSY